MKDGKNKVVFSMRGGQPQAPTAAARLGPPSLLGVGSGLPHTISCVRKRAWYGALIWPEMGLLTAASLSSWHTWGKHYISLGVSCPVSGGLTLPFSTQLMEATLGAVAFEGLAECVSHCPTPFAGCHSYWGAG